MSKTHRVIFSFDDENLDTLREMTKEGNFPTMAETVKVALGIVRALQNQVKQGYSEVTVRNPKGNDERVMVLPKILEQKRANE